VSHLVRYPGEQAIRYNGRKSTNGGASPAPKSMVWRSDFLSRAASWKTARRVVRFCSKRGTGGQRIEEGKQAVKMTRLWLSVMAQ